MTCLYNMYFCRTNLQLGLALGPGPEDGVEKTQKPQENSYSGSSCQSVCPAEADIDTFEGLPRGRCVWSISAQAAAKKQETSVTSRVAAVRARAAKALHRQASKFSKHCGRCTEPVRVWARFHPLPSFSTSPQSCGGPRPPPPARPTHEPGLTPTSPNSEGHRGPGSPTLSGKGCEREP